MKQCFACRPRSQADENNPARLKGLRWKAEVFEPAVNRGSIAGSAATPRVTSRGGGNRKKNAVVKFKMKKKNPQTIKVTISLHKILHWSLFYSCSNKAEHVKAARQTSGSDVQPKDKERFCLGLWELKMSDLFCMFNMFTFSVTVCQRD